ncbi:MAG: hypothetical protein WBL90_05575 [bacterium]|jgi:hypothetical protein
MTLIIDTAILTPLPGRFIFNNQGVFYGAKKFPVVFFIVCIMTGDV